MADENRFAIDLQDVAKKYRGKVHALRGIDVQVERGEVFGLLGPNGAGKSTLVKIMMTVVRPSRATGTILGHPLGDKNTLGRVGYLPEHHRMPQYLTGRQVLTYYAALAKVPRSERVKRADALLDQVAMGDWASKKISGYSKGMLQRIGLAQALMNDPDLIVLDEPTDGVDPVGRREIRDVLLGLKDRGKTIFLNSHLLSELEMMCNRVSILVQGQVAQQGNINELTAESKRQEITIIGEAPGWTASDTKISQVRANDDGHATMTILGDDPNAVQPIIDRLRAEGRTIVSVQPVRETLEDLFMRAVIDPETGRPAQPGAKRKKKAVAV